MNHLSLNVFLAIYDAIGAVMMLIIMQLLTGSAGWRGSTARHALGRRAIYFVITLALGFRVYSLLEARFEINLPSFLTAIVLTGGIVMLGAMRLLWPSTKLSPRAVHYTAQPEGASHCSDCFFNDPDQHACRLVDVDPASAGHCDLMFNIDDEIQTRAGGSKAAPPPRLTRE